VSSTAAGSVGGQAADARPANRAAFGAAGALTSLRRIAYWVATTVSWVAAAAVACGDVVVQETLPAAFVHEYHEPPDASWIFTVVAAVGLIVNVTESMFCGFAASRL
jgi:hypothetical protein